MSRQADGQGNDGQSRIGKTAGGKNRAADDKKIWHIMHPAIGIDHAIPGILMHAGRAHEMM
jgi:hypothetical protein